MILKGHRVMKLDSMLNNLDPYLITYYFIIGIYGPMNACVISKNNVAHLYRNGFLEDEEIEIKDTPIFSYSWFATKLLR